MEEAHGEHRRQQQVQRPRVLHQVQGAGDDPNLSVYALRQWTEELLAATFRTDFNWEIGL